MKTHKDVIDRFGGIRAMARKLEHASHTTVQGWWDRDRIPVERWSVVLQVAKREGIDVSAADLMPAEMRGAA